MENSIENVWKNGNHGNVKNIEFYNRESKLWFQQILKYLKKDNMSLIPVGLLILGMLLLYQEFLAAGLAFGFLLFLFLLNKNTITKLKNIKPSDDVQHYMKTNQVFIKNQKRNYVVFTGLIIPLFMLVELWLVFNDSEVYLNTIASISFIKKIIFAVFIYLVIGGISLFSYLISTEAIYGKLLKKLDEIVSDFETGNK
ncbi:hypothetical protein SAMN04487907_102195 [Zunongwangia mangrovi]|uniref:Uncharacterized protein n=1 Tax=Zunongwangia mangrovi TaxID=1334022 RepID=A0A1I1GBB0_9FLAO|nr:hypothetical protein [Zunongwangia mangrovi]SFC08815.1 hypothetical protein SAMN04487907_102195 [Zunongwangia mangrovi]